MMTSLRFARLGLCASIGCLLVGCDSGSGGPASRPIDSLEATSLINQRLDVLVAGLGDTTAALDTTDSTAVASTAIDSATGSSSACTPSGSTTGAPATSDGSGIGDVPKSTTDALDDFLHRVAQEAKDHVFREEFVELKDGNQVVYKIDAASACGSDSTCLDKLGRNPLRFAVTASSDGSLNVSLLVGEARLNPATGGLGEKKLSLRVSLAQSMEAVRLYADAQDQQDFPERLSGVIGGSIEKRGEGDFAISTSVIEKLDLLVGQAKGEPVGVTVLPSDPTALLTINSVTDTLGYSVNAGAVDVQVAGAAVCDDSCGDREKTGTFSGHLGGYTGGVALTKGAQELTISGLGLGNETSYVALDGDRLGTLDVNPNQGRKLSVTFKKTAEGTLVTFDPALDIKLAIMLNKLSESLRVDMPSWLGDEIFEVMLGGTAKPSVLVPAATCDAWGNVSSKAEVKVVTGELTLSSSSLASPVAVPAGMCLMGVDGAPSDANPFSQVQAGVCQ